MSDYGIYNVVGGITLIFSFLNNSMSTATARFLTFEIGRCDSEKLTRTFSTATTIHLMIAAIVFLLGETVGLWFLENKLVIEPERLDAARWVYRFSIFSAAISIIQVPYSATIIAHERMKVYAYIEIFNTALKFVIVFFLAIWHFDQLVLYAVLIFCISIIILFTYYIYCIRNFQECRYRMLWDWEIMNPMLGFSGWNVYGNMSFTARTQGVNILLNLFFGVAVNASYGIASQVQGVMQGFSQNFLTAVNPQITKLYARGEILQMENLLINASKFSFLLFFCFSFILIVENHFVLTLWLKNVPEYSVSFCQLNLISASVSCMFIPVVFVIHATGKVKNASLTIGSIYLMVIVVSYLFLRMGFSPVAPLVVNTILTVCGSFSYLWFLRYLIKGFSVFRFFIKVVFPCCAIVVLSSGVPVYFHYSLNEGWPRFLLISGVFLISFMVATYFIALNVFQRKRFLTLIMQKMSFKVG
ncbi:hypothetical protein [Ravibacter arvi]|uniref:hypothetical protein n=1 Tax=Ravibacter arvi TaxID=2051041 RepID=UPI0031E9B16E